jgi:hypothetical protein
MDRNTNYENAENEKTVASGRRTTDASRSGRRFEAVSDAVRSRAITNQNRWSLFRAKPELAVAKALAEYCLMMKMRPVRHE